MRLGRVGPGGRAATDERLEHERRTATDHGVELRDSRVWK
jgi:hypothetical protein